MSSSEQDKAKVISFGKDKTTDTSNDGDSFELHPKSWTKKTTFGGAVFL